MKTLFIKASAGSVQITKARLKAVPKPIGLVATAQYEDSLVSIRKQVPNSVVAGTVLGCDVSDALRLRKKVKSFLFVGTGRFHPIKIAMETQLPTYVYNPFDNQLSKVQDSEVQALVNKNKAAYTRFLHSATIGIVVSMKPGQQNLKKALSLKNRLDKRCYIFLADAIDVDTLRDFPFVECFVNTACPRLSEDSEIPVINYEELP